MSNERPSWKQFFFGVCELTALMSTCTRRKVGAIIVDPASKRILSTGFNGAPSKVKHCTTETCLRKDIPSGEQLQKCKAVHAEINCIAQASQYGISTKGMVMYCTHKPCSDCMKFLMNTGITTIYYKEDYPSPFTDDLLSGPEVEIKLVKIKNV